MYQSMVNSMQQHGGQVQVHTHLPAHTVAVVQSQPTAMVQGQIQQVVVPTSIVSAGGQLQHQQQQNGAVPLATHAVEVVTIDQP